MKTKDRKTMVLYTIVSLLVGFLISYSYQLTKEESVKETEPKKVWTQEYKYQKKLEEKIEENKVFEMRLNEVQESIRKIEKQLATDEDHLKSLIETLNDYRMYLGEIPVKGRGIELILSDASYSPADGTVNRYLVHEQHIYKVLNELYISGAIAISVNQQRLTKTSYIKCIGPVLSIDGYEHPAPFVIQAIGNPNTLEKSLLLSGGVIDQLRYDHVDVQLKKLDEIKMDTVIQTIEPKESKK
ncbi:MAG: DUF881 domain-containing protein [Bacillales bacterium]|nr:DUF881 domain-containing protein [Bacillales bacterium]